MTVDLVGAVHIADKAYYDELNKLFDRTTTSCYTSSSLRKGREFPRTADKEAARIRLGPCRTG